MSPRETGSTRKIEFLLRRIEKLQRRLQKILNQRDRSKIKNILIAWVFANYCCEYLAEYLSFRKENDKGFSGEKSYRTPPPEDYIDNYISIQSLPRTEKEKIIKHYETYECSNVIKDRLYDEIIKPMSMTDYSKHNDKFFKNTKILDKIRGENFPDVFPQYKNWWEKYHKTDAIINEIISNIENYFISLWLQSYKRGRDSGT